MGYKGDSDSAASTELNFIGKGTVVEGGIRTESSLRIDGKIKGSLFCKNTLTIGESGEVEGDVEATNAIIGGKIQGKVIIKEKLVLESKSSLVGELKAKKLIIDEGAIFDGTSNMGATQVKKFGNEPILKSEGQQEISLQK